MPTSNHNATTADLQFLRANPKRVGLTITNYTSVSPSGGVARYVRIANEQGNVDSGDAYILPDGHSITFTKGDGDHPERAWYCRTYSGSGWITVFESIKGGK